MSDPSKSSEAKDADSLAVTAYELSLRMLTQQESTFVDLRSRTTTMAGLAALVASLLVPDALDTADGDFPGLGVAGVGAFAVAVACILVVIWPRKRLFFEFRGTQAWEALYGHPEADQKRTLAYWLESYYDRNTKPINSAFWWHRGAVFFLVVAVILWALAILTR